MNKYSKYEERFGVFAKDFLTKTPTADIEKLNEVVTATFNVKLSPYRFNLIRRAFDDEHVEERQRFGVEAIMKDPSVKSANLNFNIFNRFGARLQWEEIATIRKTYALDFFRKYRYIHKKGVYKFLNGTLTLKELGDIGDKYYTPGPFPLEGSRIKPYQNPRPIKGEAHFYLTMNIWDDIPSITDEHDWFSVKAVYSSMFQCASKIYQRNFGFIKLDASLLKAFLNDFISFIKIESTLFNISADSLFQLHSTVVPGKEFTTRKKAIRGYKNGKSRTFHSGMYAIKDVKRLAESVEEHYLNMLKNGYPVWLVAFTVNFYDKLQEYNAKA